MSIIKDSTKIKEVLLARLKEIYPSDKGQGYQGSKVIQDASERGFKITAGCLSRYFAGKTDKSILSEEQVAWLCYRYGITIQIVVGKIVVDAEGKISTVIPPYNELAALRMLNQVYKK